MKPILLGALAAALCVSCSSGKGSGGAGGESGGTPSTGGTPANSAGAGGGSATGGSSAVGGNATTGGGPATGGSAAIGGSPTTGGSPATGGSSATGGAATTGGQSGPGGSTAAGGATTTGGRSGTGGSSAAGGSSGGTTGAGGTTSTSGARSPGCDTPIPTIPNRKTQQTIDIGGTTRYYLLNVPSNADNKTALPLVFALHGYDMNNIALVDLYNFTQQSGNKAITVLPQGEGPDPGTTSHWGDGVLKSTWSGNTANYTFLQTLMTDIEGRFCVDTKRVFITGFSMGAMFTNSLACDHTDWFRAFAPVEGGGSCTKANAKPAIIIHQGTADTLVTTTSGESTRDGWIKQNGCNQTTTSVFTGCTSYGNCVQPVVYCVGSWGHTVDQIAKANIWSFFSGLP